MALLWADAISGRPGSAATFAGLLYVLQVREAVDPAEDAMLAPYLLRRGHRTFPAIKSNRERDRTLEFCRLTRR